MGIILTLAMAVSITVGSSPDQVLRTIEGILSAREIPIAQISRGGLTTGWVEIDLEELPPYIIDNLPDDDPGWTRARFTLAIRGEKLKDKSQVSIDAQFERYGTKYRYMLVP
ncbi:hypothetical protein DRP53_05265, partial [candidate division WOR-3 bacterium]